MRHPSAPNSNGQPQHARTRGAIRTHLGRKRTGPRTRPLNDPTFERIPPVSETQLMFRAGDITSGGTITCENCGWTLRTTRTTLLPPCPQCAETTFRRIG